MILNSAGPATGVRTATPADRSTLYNLLHYEMHSHRHMDWKSPLDWLGFEPFLIAQKRGTAAALIACPPDPPEIAWIRAFAASSIVDLNSTWALLWGQARERLQSDQRVERALAIVMDDWFRDLLAGSQFTQGTKIVMLSWENGLQRPEPPPVPVEVRAMLAADLPVVAELDRLAFRPVWHISPETLSHAYTQSLIATVSEAGGVITGYQISTPSPFGGHLARLAVRPDLQGHGIGYGILYDLLQRFQSRGAMRVTVNTQADNLASQKLYQRAHFHLTGESYPIYEYLLPN